MGTQSGAKAPQTGGEDEEEDDDDFWNATIEANAKGSVVDASSAADPARAATAAPPAADPAADSSWEGRVLQANIEASLFTDDDSLAREIYKRGGIAPPSAQGRAT